MAESEEEKIQLHAVEISPNNCPLGAAMSLKLAFSSKVSVENGVWDIKYMVDMASKRKLIELGRTKATKYQAAEKSLMEISFPGIDTTGFKPHQLANAGLVIATLLDGDIEVASVNMVTQVTKKDGELFRTVYSPIDE